MNPFLRTISILMFAKIGFLVLCFLALLTSCRPSQTATITPPPVNLHFQDTVAVAFELPADTASLFLPGNLLIPLLQAHSEPNAAANLNGPLSGITHRLPRDGLSYIGQDSSWLVKVQASIVNGGLMVTARTKTVTLHDTVYIDTTLQVQPPPVECPVVEIEKEVPVRGFFWYAGFFGLIAIVLLLVFRILRAFRVF